MKIKIKQKKLITLLEQLNMNGAYPIAHIIIEEKDNTVMFRSIQKESAARSLRYFMATSDYFDDLQPSQVPFILQVEKIIKVIKNIPSEEPITITRRENKLSIEGNRISLNMNHQPVNENELITKIPLSVKYGIVHISSNVELPLDVKFNMKLSELKDIVSYASALNSTTYRFLMMNKKLKIRIGDIHELDDYIIFDSNTTVEDKTSLDVMITYGINEISNTFQQKDFTVHTGTDKPFLVQEKGEHYKLGILLPPYHQ
jgi:hypothetical protein